MTWLADTTELVPGGWLASVYAGHGVRGADVPPTGEHGAAILYAGLSLPAEANDEFRLLILTRPASLPGLLIREDSSIEVPEGSPIGAHVGTMRGYKNGVVFGTDPQNYTVQINESNISGDLVLDGPTAAGGMQSAAEISGDLATDEPAAGGGMESAAQLSGSAIADEPSAAGGLASAPDSSIAGDAPLDEPAAGGGMESAAELGGNAPLDEPTAAGGLASAPDSSIAGDAPLDEPAAGGGMESAAELGGNAPLDEPAAAGGLASDNTAGISGDAQLDEPTAAGSFEGAAQIGGDAPVEELYAGGGFSGGGPVVPPRALLEESGLTRIIRSGRRTPTKLAALDVAEVDDLYFDFAPSATAADPVQAVTVTCEARLGTDAAASAMRVGLPVKSEDAAVQRIQAGVVGVTYLVRGVATLASGRQVVAAAFLPVVRRL